MKPAALFVMAFATHTLAAPVADAAAGDVESRDYSNYGKYDDYGPDSYTNYGTYDKYKEDGVAPAPAAYADYGSYPDKYTSYDKYPDHYATYGTYKRFAAWVKNIFA
ncbi:uncharacterized protein E0L32_002431 [Thyridium curvatum]|uniref:Uncharacterized protein n=1 Tax=Thyridium curvatum TaxID=1093900 RepID=A0A507BII5_9PEZI|nr:uncharacterized protein E0L32_002431 [Thyridium curvatum]TPX18574.1 hypothetical protein E0L32_002431 [Thyridium curvatum]